METTGCIGASPAKEIKKTVKMADTCHYIPYEPSPGISSDIHCEEMEETPDYIRRSKERHRITPTELFSHKDETNFLNINSGDDKEIEDSEGVQFKKDEFYNGGDVVRTDASIGDLYRSARIGDFSYRFDKIEEGNYIIDLHFAEIVFTDGPPGMRVFDVFIQEEKVVSGMDVYAKVSANCPLVISDLPASVNKGKSLIIRFEGLIGRPIVCGISVRENATEGSMSGISVPLLGEEKCTSCSIIKKEYNLLLRDQARAKKSMEELKMENEVKKRECNEALEELRELKMELMRKSMHVGSLAFAVEGQVKEKSRWFQCLNDLSEKLELLKLERNKLSDEAKDYARCLTDFTELKTTVESIMDRYSNTEKEHAELKVKFVEESKERKDLYNKLIEMKGNIRVFCRCRPMNSTELEAGDSMVVDFESAKDGELVVRGHVSSRKVFKFDSVFSPDEDQEKVFEKTAPLATSVLDGYNVCIFAYGQTGTGKTFTMEGTEGSRGVNYRTLEELFRISKEREGLFRYEITVSVLEVYNEQIRDLLVTESQTGAASKRLEVRQVAEGVHHVPGLVEARVSSMSEAWDVLQTGSKARSTGATNANEHSSRSHCMNFVMVRGENLMNGECTKSKLWLIDLAGSERVAKTDAQGERLKEAQNINKSLSALGDVISALATKSPHIPFRNSKLTHLLQDSLSGDSKTLMFVQISPDENDVGETLCSLNFASRVRGVELGPANRQVDVSELSRYKLMAGKAKQDNKSKDAQIKGMEEMIQSLEIRNKTKDLLNRSLQDKIKELESQLLVERKLARQHVDTKIAEDHLQQFHLHKKMEETNDQSGDATQPLEESSNIPHRRAHRLTIPPTESGDILRHLSYMIDRENKENSNPELPPSDMLPPVRPQISKRVSLCTTARRVPANQTLSFRRNSLASYNNNNNNNNSNMLGPVFSPLPSIGSNKKVAVNSILRRSLQKKVTVRPPLWQAGRRGVTGVTGGVEKLRVSIGGGGNGGRKARRVFVGNGGSRGVAGQREKERGWNHGGSGMRNVY